MFMDITGIDLFEQNVGMTYANVGMTYDSDVYGYHWY